MTACNYNPKATKDDGSCKPAKDGFDCKGNKLAAGTDGATFFIRIKQPMKLSKSLSHAEVDLPENFEVGFDIMPQKTPLKSWSNIIHFTATGKVCRNLWICGKRTHTYRRQDTNLYHLSNEYLLRLVFHFDVCIRIVVAWATEFPEYGMLILHNVLGIVMYATQSWTPHRTQ